ncbi:MAG: YdcF family protein [Myxococcaceae bacterium]|nr:YdcF family protein [Myxococcaceae bacterium]
MRERAHPADVLVVLGARVRRSGEPSLALRARVEKAVALYRAAVAPRLLFSGGLGSHPPSEARAAATLAVSLGVPPEACVLEELREAAVLLLSPRVLLASASSETE